MSSQSRWFPDQRNPRHQFEPGWVLADEDRWDAEAHANGVDLTSLRMQSPRTLELVFQRPGHTPWLIRFDQLADLQIDGDLGVGLTEVGWEVIGTSMLVSEGGARRDGLIVYVLELPSTLLCFASRPGVIRAES